MKSTGVAYLFWIFFGAHYLYLGRIGTQILFWLSLFVFVGFIWWFIDLFRIPGLVAQANAALLGGNNNANVNTNVVNVNIDRDALRNLQAAEHQGQSVALPAEANVQK